MLRIILWALLGASLLSLLAGCCGNTACDCQDLLADSLYFSFPDSTKFSNAEIGTVYLARYDNASSKVSRDSLPLPRATRTTQTLRNHLVNELGFKASEVRGLLVISNNAPFSVASASSNLSRYVYRLYVPQDSASTFKKRTFTTFTFDGIGLNGNYQADGCCTCYQNTQKLVHVRGGSAYTGAGQNLDVKESGQGSNRKPVIIPLYE